MPKKPVLVTLEEFEELKTQLQAGDFRRVLAVRTEPECTGSDCQGRIDGVLKELRTKAGCLNDRLVENL